MKFSNAFSFLKLLHVTPAEIKKVTRKKFKLGLTGSPAMVESFFGALTKDMVLNRVAEGEKEKKSDFVEVISMPVNDEKRLHLKTDAIIYLLGYEDTTRENLMNFKELYKLKPPVHLFVEEPQYLEEKEEFYQKMDEMFLTGAEWIKTPFEESLPDKGSVIININKKIDMALAYRFPAFRTAMARKLIHGTSTQNMVIALASSLPAQLPVIGIIIGLLAVAGETTVLTINQLKLCMQLAGIYGLDLNMIDRFIELWPLVGSAIGFRALARSLVGYAPIAGPALKASIAYSGTYVVGEIVSWYYLTGKKLTKEERARIYDNARVKAIDLAKKYLEQIKSTGENIQAKIGKNKAEPAESTEIEQELNAIQKDLQGLAPTKQPAAKPAKKEVPVTKTEEPAEKKATPVIKTEIPGVKKVTPVVKTEKPEVKKEGKSKKADEKPKAQKVDLKKFEKNIDTLQKDLKEIESKKETPVESPDKIVKKINDKIDPPSYE